MNARVIPFRVGVEDDPTGEPLWKVDQVAEYLALSPKTIYTLPIPKVVISARCLRWHPAAVREWARGRAA
ncbi:MAG: hypothetical protein ABIQ41_11390 [Gemmatimonadales bacterium]